MKAPRYNRFSDFLQKKFGCRVHKIALDAGMSCPNRDGTLSRTGCIFCDPLGGSGRSDEKSKETITEQMRSSMEYLKKRYKAEKFIAYFQTYTNTYAPVDTLKKLYDEAVSFPDVIGLSIATRPDCLNLEILDLIESYAQQYDTWIELGIQSMHEESLQYIQRGHNISASIEAIQKIKKRPINICAHLILGLPGEDMNAMMETARMVSNLGVDAVKFHMLYVTQHSPLVQEYRSKKIKLLSQTEYVTAVTKVLENLAANIVIQRLVSEAHSDTLIAPEWLKNKTAIIQAIEQELLDQDSWQGKALA